MSSPGKKVPSKSKSPMRFNSRGEESSSAIIRGKVSDAGLDEMMKRKENLIHCFDIYELLFQNNVPQRCMAHNNFVTLYCENQHKLLCVNCIYGNSAHINHKVIPIKNAFKKIQQDNSIMKKHLKQYIEQIKTFERNTLSSKEQSQATLKVILLELEDQYNLTLNALEEKFNRMKEGIIGMFKNDGGKIELLAKQIEWLKQTYIQRQKALPTSDEESSLIFSHMMLSLMLQNDNLRESRVENIDAAEMKNNVLNELRRVHQAIINPSSPAKKRIF